MKKTIKRCPICCRTDIELIGGIGGSVAAICWGCGWSTAYHDTAEEAVKEVEKQCGTNSSVKQQIATQGKIEANGGQ